MVSTVCEESLVVGPNGQSKECIVRKRERERKTREPRDGRSSLESTMAKERCEYKCAGIIETFIVMALNSLRMIIYRPALIWK